MTQPTCFSLVVLAVTLVSAPLWAQDKRALATELFEKGKRLSLQHREEEACNAFRASLDLDVTVGALARVAQCAEGKGDIAGARAAWQRAVALAEAQGDDRLIPAKAEFHRLDKLVPRIKLSFMEAGLGPVDLQLADLKIPGVRDGASFPVNPGVVAVRIEFPGRKPWSTSVTLKADGATTGITVPKLDNANEALLVTHRPPTVGYVVGGVGIASLVAGSVFGLLALDRKSTTDTECNDVTRSCTAAGQAAASEGRTFGTLTTIGWVVGGVGLGAGLVLIVTHKKDPVKVSVGGSFGGPSGAGPSVVLRGIF
jgi:hypothetical protein